MALNTPPAPGVTPAQAAKELRTMIKNAAAQADHGQNPNVDMLKSRVLDHHGAAEKLMEELTRQLGELYLVAGNRRVGEMRKKVREIQLLTLNPLKTRINSERNYQGRLVRELEQSKTTLPFDMLRAYALVQVLPTIEQPPLGKEENTIRAITAVIKAHHGLLEEGPEMMPDGELPLVLLQRVKEEAEPQLWLPPERERKHGPFFPPYLIRGKYTLKTDRIMEAGKLGNRGFGPELGTVANWNGGNCSFIDAIETLKAVRGSFSHDRYALADSAGTVLAYADKYQVVMLTVSAKQKLGPMLASTVAPVSTVTDTGTTTTVPF